MAIFLASSRLFKLFPSFKEHTRYPIFHLEPEDRAVLELYHAYYTVII